MMDKFYIRIYIGNTGLWPTASPAFPWDNKYPIILVSSYPVQ